jgi:hypothetical protein
MSRDMEAMAEGFAKHMRKLALGNVGTAAATGATILGLGNAVKRYSESRAEGRGVGESLGQGARGALIGAGAGAAVGGGLAGVSSALRGGQAIGPGTPWYKSMDEGLANFGRRQRHGLTGYVPEGMSHGQYVRHIGIGSGTSEAVEGARRNVELAASGQSPYRIPIFSKWRAARDLHSAQAARDSSEALIENQVTSIPGLVRGLAGPNRGKVLGSIAKNQWHGSDALTKAMIAGDAYEVGKATLNSDTQDPAGRSRGELIGSGVGRMAGLLVPSPMPFAGQFVAGTALGMAGGRIGKGLSRHATKPSIPTPLYEASPSHDTHISPEAAGQSGSWQ